MLDFSASLMRLGVGHTLAISEESSLSGAPMLLTGYRTSTAYFMCKQLRKWKVSLIHVCLVSCGGVFWVPCCLPDLGISLCMLQKVSLCVFEVMVFGEDEISQTLQAHQSLQVL